MKNPLRAIFDFDRRELPVALLLFVFYFLIIAVFQILKPLKNGLFVEHYGADIELYAKLANIIVAAVAVAAYSLLYSKLRRNWLIYVLCGFFVVGFLVLIWALRSPSALPIWAFYFLGDLETTLMVAAFWAYATDLTDSDQAKRLFGVVGGGGVVGGWVGISLAKVLLSRIGMAGLLFWSAVMIALVAIATAVIEYWTVKTRAFRLPDQDKRPVKPEERKKSSWTSALDGARLVMVSRYLLAIALIMLFYEIASQLMDYQFKKQTEGLAGVEATQASMIDVYFYANMLSVFVQFFLVSLIMRKAGLTVALLVLPVAAIASSTAFLLVPTLLVSSFLVISDNGFNYSIQQTARESLYVVTSRDEKYKARAFTNMFVQRVAKGISIVGALGLAAAGIAPRWLSLATIVVAVGMIAAGIYAGRRFREKSAELETVRPAA